MTDDCLVDTATLMTIKQPPPPNLHLQMGDPQCGIQWHLREEKTWVNRFKWWMFSHFFPFAITKWESTEDADHERK